MDNSQCDDIVQCDDVVRCGDIIQCGDINVVTSFCSFLASFTDTVASMNTFAIPSLADHGCLYTSRQHSHTGSCRRR